MNIRVLDKNDKASLEQLIYTIENALPVPEWWIPIDDIERSHFFDADWTCFLGAFNDDNELVAASALFSLMNMNLLRKLKSSVSTFILQM